VYDVTAELETREGGPWAVCAVRLPVAAEVVFDAVATGEGISSWFVPCALEPHVGGRVVQFADPGAPDPTSGPEAAVEASLTAVLGEVTAHTPPAGGRPGVFEYVEREWMGADLPVPPWTTRVEVEAVGEAGTDTGDSDGPHTLLTLRSGFTSGGTLPETAAADSLDGWRDALHVLAHRLTHRPASGVVTVLAATEPVDDDVPGLWRRVLGRLDTTASGVGGGDASGEGRVLRDGEVGGVVLASSEASVTVVLSAPADGVVQLSAFPAGESAEDASGRAALAVRVYEYVDAPGSDGAPLGAAALDGVEPTWDSERWRAWADSLAAD